MGTLGQDLRAHIVSSTAVAAALSTDTAQITKSGVVEIDNIPEKPQRPRLWLSRQQENEALDLEGTALLVESDWTIEVISTDHTVRNNIVAKLKKRLRLDYATMGSTANSRLVQNLSNRDHDDDYLPRGLASDEGLYVSALAVTIHSTST
jgi:hypothetical protein